MCAPVLQKERERDRNKTDPILLILNISLSPSVNLTSQWTCPYFISFLDDSFLSNIAIFNGYVSLPDCQLQSIQRALRIEWLGLPPERYNPHRRQDAWSGWSLLSYIIYNYTYICYIKSCNIFTYIAYVHITLNIYIYIHHMLYNIKSSYYIIYFHIYILHYISIYHILLFGNCTPFPDRPMR